MNKTIIAVYGTQSVGKSDTIRRVCASIMANFPTAISNPITINYNGDILVTIQLGAVKIGIESQGDPNSRIISQDTLRKLADITVDPVLGGCDIIVCASRTSGATVDVIELIANQYNYFTVWKSTYQTPNLNTDVLNNKAAEEIIDIIKSIIVGQL